MKCFVFTCIARMEGLHIMRADLEALALSKGHSVMDKVGVWVDYLVTDSKRMTQKRIRAESLAINIVTTKEFIDMMGGQIELKDTLGV